MPKLHLLDSNASTKRGISPVGAQRRVPRARRVTRWKTLALDRPLWEPPVLDYRKFEEDGEMYHSLNRHPDTKPEQWYEYTDAEIDRDVLGDYSQWVYATLLAARTTHDAERQDFYVELGRELEIDLHEADEAFYDVEERRWREKESRAKSSQLAGKRVQDQFDGERKAWRLVDSSDSEWDEDEWRIFGLKSNMGSEQRVGDELTEKNLKVLQAQILEASLLQETIQQAPIPDAQNIGATGTMIEDLNTITLKPHRCGSCAKSYATLAALENHQRSCQRFRREERFKRRNKEQTKVEQKLNEKKFRWSYIIEKIVGLGGEDAAPKEVVQQDSDGGDASSNYENELRLHIGM